MTYIIRSSEHCRPQVDRRTYKLKPDGLDTNQKADARLYVRAFYLVNNTAPCPTAADWPLYNPAV